MRGAGILEAKPNGQTLLVAPDAIVTLFPHVFREVGYDPFRDLTPISQVLSWSFGFAVPAASPAKTFVTHSSSIAAICACNGIGDGRSKTRPVSLRTDNWY